MSRNTEAVLEASRKVGAEVNTEKSKCMVMPCHKNIRKLQFTD